MTTVSILLPTYNGSHFLEEQIHSISSQSFEDWELLICDDGSNDATISVAMRLAAQDKRIAIIPSEGNMGQRRRLQQLADVARSDLVAVSDQDDIWAPEKLEKLIDGLGDADLCFGSSWLIDGNGAEFGRELSASLPPHYRAGDRLTWIFRPLVSAHAMLVRRKLFGGSVFTRALAFDWLISLEAAFGSGIVYVPTAQTRHRLHDTNQSNGWFANTPRSPRFISRTAVQTLSRNVERERLFVTSILEHLTFADTLDAQTRQRARAAHQACLDAWYANWVGGYSATRTLPDRIERHLKPLAGSEEDWQYFKLRFDQLCMPLLTPSRLSMRRRRLAIEWPK